MATATLSELTRSTLDLFFPPHCVSCRARGSAFCSVCRSKMILPANPLCWRCGRSLLLVLPTKVSQQPPLCPDCFGGNGPHDVSWLRAVAVHEGTAREAIHALKYQGRRRVAMPLGDLLAHYLQNWAHEVDLVIPIPLHAERQRERGFNQSALLARRCAGQLSIPYLPRALIRQRATRPQVGLSKEERRANVLNAFIPGRQGTLSHLAGKHVVLIDDVMTTGSTLNSAAAALAPLHPSSVSGLAVTRPAFRWLPTTHLIWLDDRDQRQIYDV